MRPKVQKKISGVEPICVHNLFSAALFTFGFPLLNLVNIARYRLVCSEKRTLDSIWCHMFITNKTNFVRFKINVMFLIHSIVYYFYKWQCQDGRYCMCSISRKTLNTHTHLTEERNILGDKERQQIRKTKKYWPCANFLKTCLSQHQIQGLNRNYCTEILSEWFAVYDQSDSFVLLLQH